MLMPFNDYVRAYRVIRSVLESYTDAHDLCIAFAIGGARILREHYGVEARICIGGAVYVLGTDRWDVLSYGRHEDGAFLADRTAFHCWVHAEDYVIDFMAPMFPEIMRRDGRPTRSAPRMFQKRRVEARDLDALEKPGDFAYHSLDPASAIEILEEPLSGAEHEDMWETMTRWFVPCPRKIRRSVELLDLRTNETLTVQLSHAPVDGTL